MRRARSLSVCNRTPATPFGRRDRSSEAIAEAMPLEATTTSSPAPEARRSATSAAMSRALARRRRGGIVGVGSIVRYRVTRAAIAAATFVVLIAIVAALAGRAARWTGQPAMIGYVVAGAIAAFVLPRGASFDAALRACALLGELGVLALMFTSGAEMDGGELWSRARRAIPLTLAVIATPFAAGLALAPRFPQLRGAGADPIAFTILIATCLTVTAFPVLIEILRDRRMLATPVGVTAAGIAAVNDVVAWLLLAFVAFWSAKAAPPLLTGPLLRAASSPSLGSTTAAAVSSSDAAA